MPEIRVESASPHKFAALRTAVAHEPVVKSVPVTAPASRLVISSAVNAESSTDPVSDKLRSATASKASLAKIHKFDRIAYILSF